MSFCQRGGPVLGGCGVHAWGVIFPWTAVACVTHQEADLQGIWLPGGVQVGLGVSKARQPFGPDWRNNSGLGCDT